MPCEGEVSALDDLVADREVDEFADGVKIDLLKKFLRWISAIWRACARMPGWRQPIRPNGPKHRFRTPVTVGNFPLTRAYTLDYSRHSVNNLEADDER
jgi:hypothetical protein